MLQDVYIAPCTHDKCPTFIMIFMQEFPCHISHRSMSRIRDLPIARYILSIYTSQQSTITFTSVFLGQHLPRDNITDAEAIVAAQLSSRYHPGAMPSNLAVGCQLPGRNSDAACGCFLCMAGRAFCWQAEGLHSKHFGDDIVAWKNLVSPLFCCLSIFTRKPPVLLLIAVTVDMSEPISLDLHEAHSPHRQGYQLLRKCTGTNPDANQCGMRQFLPLICIPLQLSQNFSV